MLYGLISKRAKNKKCIIITELNFCKLILELARTRLKISKDENVICKEGSFSKEICLFPIYFCKIETCSQSSFSCVQNYKVTSYFQNNFFLLLLKIFRSLRYLKNCVNWNAMNYEYIIKKEKNIFVQISLKQTFFLFYCIQRK